MAFIKENSIQSKKNCLKYFSKPRSNSCCGYEDGLDIFLLLRAHNMIINAQPEDYYGFHELL